jgi:hypothetical protein
LHGAEQIYLILLHPVACDQAHSRWVGLGVIADNLINIGRAMAKQSVP